MTTSSWIEKTIVKQQACGSVFPNYCFFKPPTVCGSDCALPAKRNVYVYFLRPSKHESNGTGTIVCFLSLPKSSPKPKLMISVPALFVLKLWMLKPNNHNLNSLKHHCPSRC